ncbi:MAG: metalloregulator ArsR/SmtB family transcription factor [Geoalkalibacter sp.]|uniref:ArsR/SmtB family transcription factor n=1 Tax=Geoalkalibacter sp. TaxID=3041440 RepID=UPI002A93930C|nr:metalloregulator ArsR/SmtB family transcription factor [Thermodesulfobacteriota bacterium]
MKLTAKIFKALSDETRLRILALLQQGELCVCDLMAVLELPQSTVSRHLANLRHAALVDDRRRGVWMFYSLAPPPSGLHQDLADLLARRLPESAQAQADRRRLKQLLESKERQVC